MRVEAHHAVRGAMNSTLATTLQMTLSLRHFVLHVLLLNANKECTTFGLGGVFRSSLPLDIT